MPSSPPKETTAAQAVRLLTGQSCECGRPTDVISLCLSTNCSHPAGPGHYIVPQLHIEIPAARHHLMVDQPLAFVAALRGLLAAWPRSTAWKRRTGKSSRSQSRRAT